MTNGGECFDHDLFKLALRMFHWFDKDTKLCFLEFYRQALECTSDHNIEEFSSFKAKNFTQYMKQVND